MERHPQALPLIRYAEVAGELRPQTRILVIEVPIETSGRNRAIRRLARRVELKELAGRFGLSISQVWRIIRGCTSGKNWPRNGRGKTRR